MGYVIAVCQGKGGSGKTTTAINLACALKERGHSVLICDMDRDKPDALNWSNAGNGVLKTESMVKEIFMDNPMPEIEKIKSNYDFILLDTPPNFQSASIKAVMLSDYVVLPTSDSMLDQLALSDAVSIPKMAKKPYSLLANRVDKRSKLSQMLLNSIKETGSCFEAYITSRKKMVESQFEGKWIGEYDKNGDNHKQYQEVVKELLEKLKVCHEL
jgi:chromosome partitioning protein|tara:strand:+ start:1255 stop:1896 length:642 start_codon:yes stop_codon:yes gene_type:complete